MIAPAGGSGGGGGASHPEASVGHAALSPVQFGSSGPGGGLGAVGGDHGPPPANSLGGEGNPAGVAPLNGNPTGGDPHLGTGAPELPSATPEISGGTLMPSSASQGTDLDMVNPSVTQMSTTDTAV